MCTVNEEYDEAREFVPKEYFQILDNALCQKCSTEKALVILRGKDFYCKTCFLAGVTHKFRATLGKSKIVRPTDKILVAYSGKSGSTALLHLIKAGMHESVHKRLVFETKVLYVDDGAAIGADLEQRREKINSISKQISSLGFETFAVSLSQVFNEEELQTYTLENLRTNLSSFLKSDERLRNNFFKLSDRTSKLELLRNLRRKVLFAASKKLACNKIFLADDSTALAIDILSNVALGKGAQLSLDVGFIDDRYSKIIFLRPMRDFSSQEIELYLDFHGLKSIEIEDSSLRLESIQEITGKFVKDLDSRFTGTVSTIFRTGEKLSSFSTGSRGIEEKCALCDAFLDTNSENNVISAIQATNFSKLVSSKGPNGKLEPEIDEFKNLSLSSKDTINKCGNCDGACSKNPEMDVSLNDLKKFLCYGCRLIFQNSQIPDVPKCILESVKRKLSLETMKQEITDFLL